MATKYVHFNCQIAPAVTHDQIIVLLDRMKEVDPVFEVKEDDTLVLLQTPVLPLTKPPCVHNMEFSQWLREEL